MKKNLLIGIVLLTMVYGRFVLAGEITYTCTTESLHKVVLQLGFPESDRGQVSVQIKSGSEIKKYIYKFSGSNARGMASQLANDIKNCKKIFFRWHSRSGEYYMADEVYVTLVQH